MFKKQHDSVVVSMFVLHFWSWGFDSRFRPVGCFASLLCVIVPYYCWHPVQGVPFLVL